MALALPERLRCLGVLLLAALLAGCGAGASDSLLGFGVGTTYDPDATLQVTPASVPAARAGIIYETTPLGTTGARGDVLWSLVEGRLPEGMTLTGTGEIVGIPKSAGLYEFTARATDGVASAEQRFALSVDTFGITAESGLKFGDAWCGTPVQLRCLGFEVAVSFEVVVNGSGGHLEQVHPSAGTAVWIPGPRSDEGTQDVVTTRCLASGATAEITLDIVPDVTESHVARFGESDVWYLDFECKHGHHAYATDWHAALAKLGLRNPASTSTLGSRADQLTDFVVRVEVLRKINTHFLRNRDGTGGAAELAISFPLTRPGLGYLSPLPGGMSAPGRTSYNVMALCNLTSDVPALGMALTDDVHNGTIENVSPGGPYGPLGTFVNHIANGMTRSYTHYSALLRDSPVVVSDIEALKRILLGRGHWDAREDLLRYFIRGLAEQTANLASHEIGHSLGIHHAAQVNSLSLMNDAALIQPYERRRFSSESIEQLRARLPGPNRSVGGASRDAAP